MRSHENDVKKNIRHEESPTLHTFRRSFFKITYITSSYLKKRGGWGEAQPPNCKPLEKLTLTVKKEGSLLDTIPVHVPKKRVVRGDSSPSVQTVEIEGCDNC